MESGEAKLMVIFEKVDFGRLSFLIAIEVICFYMTYTHKTNLQSP
jgi:hypothetical protein